MTHDRHVDSESVVRRVGRADGAQTIARYLRLLEADPTDTRALLKVGEFQIRQGAVEEAAVIYRRAADAFATQGQALRAIATYATVWELVTERATNLLPAYAYVPFAIAELYVRSDLPGDAVATLENAARFHTINGSYTEAARLLRKATDLSHENVPLRLKLAEALSRGQDMHGSAAELGVAAWQLVAKSRPEEALPVLERLLHLESDPAFARLAADLYLARATRPDATHALKKLKICMRANPRDLEALRLLVRAFEILGHAEKVAAVQQEISDIAQERRLPPADVPPVKVELLGPSDANAPGDVHVIPVSAESWNLIASSPAERNGRLVAFVCTGENGRDTMRTIYGIVKSLAE